MRERRYDYYIQVLSPQNPYTEHPHLPLDAMSEDEMWAYTRADRVKELRDTLKQSVALGYPMQWSRFDRTTRTFVCTTYVPKTEAAAQMPDRNYRALIARYPHLANEGVPQ